MNFFNEKYAEYWNTKYQTLVDLEINNIVYSGLSLGKDKQLFPASKLNIPHPFKPIEINEYDSSLDIFAMFLQDLFMRCKAVILLPVAAVVNILESAAKVLISLAKASMYLLMGSPVSAVEELMQITQHVFNIFAFTIDTLVIGSLANAVSIITNIFQGITTLVCSITDLDKYSYKNTVVPQM